MNTQTANEIIVPLNQLVLSPLNMRYAEADDVFAVYGGRENVAELAENILSVGVRQNLNIIMPKKKTAKKGVVAGGRRLAALSLLLEQGRIADDYPVPCRPVSEAEALLVSISENTMREAVHPLDEFASFQKLIAEGKSITDVAATFGVSELVVKRRLRLANLAPTILEAARVNDEIGLDILMAFALVDDHARQLAAFEYYQQRRHLDADDIKTLLADEKPLISGNRLMLFVGLDAYQAAGGKITRDLFSDETDGIIENPEILNNIASAKLAEFGKAQTNYGNFVAIDLDNTYKYAAQEAGFLSVPTTKLKPSEEQESQLLSLQAQIESVESRLNALYNDDEADQEEIETLETELESKNEVIESIEDGLETVLPEIAALAGSVVFIDREGSPQFIPNLVKKSDGETVRQALKETGNDIGGEAASLAEKAKAERGGHSTKLNQKLTAYQTVILRQAVMANPETALRFLIAELASRVKGEYFNDSAFDVRLDKKRLDDTLNDENGSAALAALKEAQAGVFEGLESSKQLMDWAFALDSARLLEVLAALLIDGLEVVSASAKKSARATLIEKYIPVDYAAHWKPTASNYLMHVSKEQVIGLVRKYCGDAEAAKLQSLKKVEVVALAQGLLEGSGWLPEMMGG